MRFGTKDRYIAQTELGCRQGLQTGHTKISIDQTSHLDFEQTLGTLGQTEQSLSRALTRLNTLRPDRCSDHWTDGTHPEQDYCPNPLKRKKASNQICNFIVSFF